jgi:hypothetical protein
MTALIDTGASHSFVSEPAVKQFELKTDTMKSMKIGLADGATASTTMKVRGAQIIINGKPTTSDLIVLTQMNPRYHVIVGIDIIQQTQLIDV